MSNASDTAILIPSYQPDGKLAPYVKALHDAGFAKIVVVDDGSGANYRAIFDSLEQPDGAVAVLHYEPNGGKGRALKTGLQYIQQHCPDCQYVITADSDGQHTVTDTLRMADALHENDEGLLLGSRDFSLPNVPPKSRMGNRITTAVFWLLYGKKVPDTQTGLRGFSRKLISQFIATKGDRYEYEMNQLIDCASARLPIRTLTIETVYEGNNEGSHFRAFRDSARIYRCIFAGFFRFISASLTCFVVDYGLYLLFNALFKAYVPAFEREFRLLFVQFLLRIGVATVASRVISGLLNYYLNRRFVFASKLSVGKTFARYLCCFFLVMFLSAGLVSSLHIGFGWNENVVKIPVDLLLFFFNYYLQRRWVFSKKDELLKGTPHNAA